MGHLHESAPQAAPRLISYRIFMLRISGVTIPDNKRLEIGLTTVYGVGRPRAQETLTNLGIDPGKRPTDLSAAQESSLREAIEKFAVEGELKREISGNIRRLKDIKSYRGSRHQRGLPSRGQRTKTNSRTRRGNVRKTMGTGRKVADKK